VAVAGRRDSAESDLALAALRRTAKQLAANSRDTPDTNLVGVKNRK
jgi:hypothetical protein